MIVVSSRCYGFQHWRCLSLLLFLWLSECLPGTPLLTALFLDFLNEFSSGRTFYFMISCPQEPLFLIFFTGLFVFNLLLVVRAFLAALRLPLVVGAGLSPGSVTRPGPRRYRSPLRGTGSAVGGRGCPAWRNLPRPGVEADSCPPYCQRSPHLLVFTLSAQKCRLSRRPGQGLCTRWGCLV